MPLMSAEFSLKEPWIFILNTAILIITAPQHKCKCIVVFPEFACCLTEKHHLDKMKTCFVFKTLTWLYCVVIFHICREMLILPACLGLLEDGTSLCHYVLVGFLLQCTHRGNPARINWYTFSILVLQKWCNPSSLPTQSHWKISRLINLLLCDELII